MRNFIGTVIGLTASTLAVVGSGAIFFVSIALAVTVHWSFGFGIFLFPIWAAAMIAVVEAVS